MINMIKWEKKNTAPLQNAFDQDVKIGWTRFTIKLVRAGPSRTSAANIGNKSTSKGIMR
jgi:hypothetical protein